MFRTIAIDDNRTGLYELLWENYLPWMHAVQSRATKQEDDVCPFCRAPTPISDEELMKRLEKRIELKDASAIQSMGYHYVEGRYGLPRNMGKALELWHRAGELGNTEAYCNVGSAYKYGDGVEKDEKKSKHYYDIAAMRGDEEARHNLGCIEWRAGYIYRALMHWMIAATDGDLGSLKKVKSMYRDGLATKDDYAKTLRSYQAYLDDIKSDQRDEAAAAKDIYKYYDSSHETRRA